MSEGSAAQIPRPRLVAALATAPVGLVEAPGGFGKSVLAAELIAHLGLPALDAGLTGVVATPALLAAALQRGAERAGLSDLATDLRAVRAEGDVAQELARALAASASTPVVVIDEVELVEHAAAQTLADLAGEDLGGARLLILGRRLPAGLRALPSTRAARLGAEELAFSRREVAAVLSAALGEEAGHAEYAAVYAAGEGWPALTALAAARLAREPGTTRARLSSSRRTLALLVDDVLAGLAPEAARLAAQLAHVPLLSPRIVDAIAGEGAFEALVRAGLPIVARRDGWHELPGRLREELAGRGVLAGETADCVAAAYVSGGELTAAIELLARSGRHDSVAELLAGTPLDELSDVALPVLYATLAGVPDEALARRPRAILAVARVAHRNRDTVDCTALLARAARVGGADARTERELDAERALDAYGRRDLVEMARLAASVLDHAGADEPIARARALVARAIVASEQEDLAGAHDLEQAIALFAAAGATRWRGEALAMLAYRFWFHEGSLAAAGRTMQDALACMPGPTADRASWLTFRLDIATYAGEFAEAEAALGEAEVTARALHEHRVLAYAAWGGALLAAAQRDVAVCTQRFLLAERQGGYERGSGVLLLCDAAAALARLGQEEAARGYLERAELEATAIGHEPVTLLPRGIVESRFGDPVRAEEALRAYTDAPDDLLAPRDEWRVLLERAWAARRRGDDEVATTLASRAFEAARARGLEQLPALHEPDLVAVLAPLASAAGSEGARRAEAREPELAISTLGRFAVTADGQALMIPAGHPTTLLKLLAVAAGPVALDAAAESLWPETDAETAKRRMRNVLNRVRAAGAPELVVREGEALSLGRRVRVDLRVFARDARAALNAGADGAALARSALSLYSGDLLPADRYAPWAEGPRDEARRRALELLDLLVGHARERGELDEAIRLLDQAITIEPGDEARQLECAELLLAQGRRGSARDVVERARRQHVELGRPPSLRIERLMRATQLSQALTGY